MVVNSPPTTTTLRRLDFVFVPHSFLGTVDSIGTSYTEDFIATGYGGHLGTPILRDEWRADMTEAEARELLSKCMRVLYYRDCRAINKMTFSKVTAEGPVVMEPESLDTKVRSCSTAMPHPCLIHTVSHFVVLRIDVFEIERDACLLVVCGMVFSP